MIKMKTQDYVCLVIEAPGKGDGYFQLYGETFENFVHVVQAGHYNHNDSQAVMRALHHG